MAGVVIAAAVVTYSGRVLLIRRAVAEGTLSWQFAAGKMQPGEKAEEAAMREAAEETGIEVSVARLLGERLHPATGSRIAYVACTVADATARVASLREADDLTGGMIHEPVRQCLSEVAGSACS
jgi:8-oxo-dGTP diphosphatase